MNTDKIACFGTGEVIPFRDDEVIDCKGGMVMPAFCDSHTHLVYAGSREKEYEDKISGLSYEEIAKRGGGILNSAACFRNFGKGILRTIPAQGTMRSSGRVPVQWRLRVVMA